MDLYPITLTAQRGAWLKFDSRRRNKKFVALKKRVLARDQNTCRYCGFVCNEFQEIVNKDKDYDNNKFDNLVTSCSFCTQCFFLDVVGTAENMGGVIIHLPEISQADLNNFCRVLFCSMDKESAYKGKLLAVYMSFKDRSKEVINCFGPESSDPKVFGQGLIDSYLTPDQLQHEVLQHLRLLPARHAFKKQIEYWKKTVFAKVPL